MLYKICNDGQLSMCAINICHCALSTSWKKQNFGYSISGSLLLELFRILLNKITNFNSVFQEEQLLLQEI